MSTNTNPSLTITKEKVLEAASKCSTAKEVLKTMFPECFEVEHSLAPLCLAEPGYIFTDAQARAAGFRDNGFLKVFRNGFEANTCFYLSDSCATWTLEKVPMGYKLIPTRKTS